MTQLADPRIIERMPLHDITARYGERGLRQRLTIEITQFAEAAGRQKIEQALDLACRLHRLDRRQSEPYFNHVLRVALRIIVHYDVRDADIICAALLHDTVEDHAGDLSLTGRSGALAVLNERFGPQVADLVQAVTNPVYTPESDKHDQYRAHLAASLEAHPWSRVVKASDFTDNGFGLHYTTGPKAAELARKYTPMVPILADLIARPDTPLTGQANALILRQLNTATERFAAIAQQEGR
jgi:(p)ppGpp synthase/HD superfamily hydrolase